MWNYKTALLSATVRGLLFFSTNLTAGLDAATGALLTEFAFRFVTAGFYGSLTQRLRRIEPPAAGLAAALVLLPSIAHSVEYVLHSARGTPALGASIAASVTMTLISTTFHLFVMRRGVLITGAGEQSLLDDLKAMPRLVVMFVVATARACPRIQP
jgi:hypothetical protein